ncbi:DUF1499 domain-containing protein [Pseudooctadecabacter jejudonensis]|uniref:DUF1499 domain-containing protein n=1 Tax=Pseudooctadecabacter jejudonensis TaxID=1391910 RepID=A0A1Y5RJA0_9RHOB|nr:DUF1499 domain-containing protein [Pseudooctadecabacter jejudonensis]SLN18658.1 hypothetical protein PSJ8397_00616 [Pseudooctadecabacter jejudonensis]
MIYIAYALIGLLGAILVALIYVRVAPTKPSHWHEVEVPLMAPGAYPSAGGHLIQRVVQGDGVQMMAQLDQIICATARTSVVAGTVEDNKTTYMTRTKICGFPDFTTVRLMTVPDSDDCMLQVYGRLRFGQSDLGVNRKRIDGWMAQLDAMGGAATPTP